MNADNANWRYARNTNQSLLAVYFGTHADKYLLAQEKLGTPPRKIYWNWAAAVWGPVWLFYKKLYFLLFIWLLIGVPFDFLYFAAPRLDPTLNNPFMAILVKYYVLLSVGFVLASNLFLGCWGTYYYLQQSERMVNLAKSKAPYRIAADLLAEKGNPSYWRLVGGVIVIGGIYLLTILLASLWSAAI